MNKLTNALLVYPKVPDNTYWSFKHALQFIRKKSSMPPLGLITLAALFPKSINLRLIDLNIEKLRKKDLEWADAVFVSAMIIQKDSFDEVVAMCHAAGKPVIAGGPYATTGHEGISGVDHFVLGEVENTFAGFLEDFQAGEAKKVYLPPEKPSLDQTPVPRFDLLKMKHYASMSVQYSRGCPFNCEFCDIWKVYGNKPRLKSAPNMVRELQALTDLGWQGPLFIVDDNFIGNKRRVKTELLPAVTQWQKDRNYPFRFFTEASINLADDDALLQGMSDAGFNEVFIGIETPSAEGLKETGKTQNLKCDMAQAVKKIQEYGIEVMAGFILGFDSDTEDIVERQVAFIQQTGIPQAMVGILTALPGTELHSRLEREGRLLRVSDGNNTHSLTANFKTKMDVTTLAESYTRLMSTIYDKNLKNYFARCSKLLDNVGDPVLSMRKIHFSEIMMLVRSLARQPFTPYGYQYLKFITTRFVKNRSTFSEAVKFSIVGHHFHKITRQMIKAQGVA
ncbi:MAG: B12-binding domain-containing radical SAM protein [Desulfatibacillum sp.]|nr:B12-binding domain-containing radical SAM protein [Desulfatibacillum sp.]